MQSNLSGARDPIPPVERSPDTSELAEREEEAILRERIRSIKRRTLTNDVSVYSKMGLAILVAVGLGGSIIVYFIHHLLPWQWLNDQQLQSVDGLFRFAITAFSFFLAGRHRAIEQFLSGGSEE